MKKYVITIITLLLIFASALSSSSSFDSYITAGPGNDKDSKAEDLVDLYSVLSYIRNRTSSNQSSAYSLSDEDNDSINKIRAKGYNSVTFTEFSESSSQSTYKTISGYYNDEFGNKEPQYSISSMYKVKSRSNLTVYVTKREAYYIAKGCTTVIYYNYEDNDNGYTLFLEYDLEVYTKSDDYMLVKINNFTESKTYDSGDEEKRIVMEEFREKWVKISGGHSSVFSYITAGSLSSICSIIAANTSDTEQSKFKESQDIYTIKDKKGGLYNVINLSTPAAPYIELEYDRQDDESNDYSYSYYVATIQNINNTDINVNDDADVDIDRKSFNALFDD